MQKNFLVQIFGILFTLFLLSFESHAQTEDYPIEVGAFVTTIDFNDSVREQPIGFGGRFAYNFTDNLAVDSEVSYFPEDPSGNFGETIVVAGLRAGVKIEKFGVFAKVRPGFVHFGSDAFRAFNDSPTRFAIDVGGVLEFYPSKRVILRVDLGDTIIPFGDDTINSPVPPFVFRPGTTHNLQASFGVGFRF
jgi:hypothetical protein